jgi:hypothetical protein
MVRAWYTRRLGPWPIEPHGTSLFGWDHGKIHGPWLKGLSSQCKPNLDQKNRPHLNFFINYFVKKKFGNVAGLIFYSFPVSSFYLSHFRFFLFVCLFSFHNLFFFFLFCTFYKQSDIIDKERNNYLLWWLCIGVCIFDSTSVEHSSFNFKVWNGEICIVCSHLWIHVEKKNERFELLKGNMDWQMDS